MWKGVLDHIDTAIREVDTLRKDIRETLDPAVVREQRTRATNAITILNEARRMLERTGQETR